MDLHANTSGKSSELLKICLSVHASSVRLEIFNMLTKSVFFTLHLSLTKICMVVSLLAVFIGLSEVHSHCSVEIKCVRKKISSGGESNSIMVQYTR